MLSSVGADEEVPLPVTGRDAQRVARLGLPRNIFHAPIIERDLVERRL